MPLKRTEHYRTRELDAFFRSRMNEPFAWAKNDCCLFPADGILAMTGTDIASDFRSKYTDKTSAFALIKAVTGGSTVADAAAYCAKKAGLAEYPTPLHASCGDLVVMENGGELIAGLVHLTGQVASVVTKGWTILPISGVQRAWKV